MEQKLRDESEKRFHSIMDRLFHSPKSPSSSLSVQTSRGKKRLNPSSALALVEPRSASNFTVGASMAPPLSSEAPICRPWDRGDLMRRLATFKSMTWFAKPEAVSALNCARRGWINIDIDTISCEACGARFLFSTPSAWNQEQVEKVAAVFSLKLDQGHKLLCPWIDNVCDELLSQFPPMPPPVLVDKFKERWSTLLQLSALPVISSSAIEHMRSPQFEQILDQPLMLDYEKASADTSRTEYLGDERDVDSERKYYQAQMLISLCGWEPRVLPYVVDVGCRSSQVNADATNSRNIVANKQNTSINVQSARNEGLPEANGNSNKSNNGLQSDPSSIVLDCRLCGASVGLWAFSIVSRPLEFVRLVGYAEIGGENHSGMHNSGSEANPESTREITSAGSHSAAVSGEGRHGLNFTIAGGPQPAKQNFKATISLPVIGRNLRARFCCDSEFSDRVVSNLYKVDVSARGDVAHEENDNQMPSGEMAVIRTGALSEDGIDKNEMENLSAPSQDNCLDEMLLENAGNGGLENSTQGGPGSSHVRDPLNIVTDDNMNGIDTNEGIERSVSDLLQISGTNAVHDEDTFLGGDDESPWLSFCLDGHIDIEIIDTYCQTTSGAEFNSQKDGEGNMQISVNNELVSRSTEKDLKQISLDQEMQFDPIRQHRHFCPWIASTGKATPGWKQTLLALHRQRGFSPSSSEKSPSASIIKVDDPITSVRKLFMSPSPKRMKLDLLTNQTKK